jgi:hypothetical protein
VAEPRGLTAVKFAELALLKKLCVAMKAENPSSRNERTTDQLRTFRKALSVQAGQFKEWVTPYIARQWTKLYGNLIPETNRQMVN